MKKSLLIISFIVASVFTKAQSTDFGSLYTFGWNVEVPVGDRLVKAASYAGANLEYRGMIGSRTSVGIGASWNSFYKYVPQKTYAINQATDITTDLYTYLYTLPLTASVHQYFPITNSIFVPYAGLALGGIYSDQNVYFNIYEFPHDNWGFLVRPEIGTIIKFDRTADMGLMLGVRYSLSTNDVPSINAKSVQSVGFNLGLVWLR